MSDKAIYGKCGDCGHVWPVAQLPMEVTKVARLMKRAAGPMCGCRKVFLAPATREAQADA